MRNIVIALSLLAFTTAAAAQEVTIKVSAKEARALRELINLAVKAAGLPAAEAGVVLDKKISAAMAEVDKAPLAKTGQAQPKADEGKANP